MLPFQSKRSNLAKLDVLETKFNIYEELSRQMLDKLESAVDKISEANSTVANMLTKHDERIEQTLKNDQLFIKEIDNMKKENKEDHNRVLKRIEKLEVKLEDFVKFRWILVGAVIILSFVFSQSSLVVDILTPSHHPARIDRTK
jgi:hypothetical protein